MYKVVLMNMQFDWYFFKILNILTEFSKVVSKHAFASLSIIIFVESQTIEIRIYTSTCYTPQIAHVVLNVLTLIC